MAGTSPAEEQRQFAERSRRLLVTRARIGLWILLTFIVLFSLADYLFNPGGFAGEEIRQLTILRASQVVVILASFGALSRRKSLQGVTATCVVIVALFNATIALAGVVVRDSALGPIVLMSTSMFCAAFLPWRPLAQVIVAATAALCISASAAMVGDSFASVFGYTQLEAFAGLAASVWVANSLHRHRAELFFSQRARDAAIAAQLLEARVSDGLARFGREMIEVAAQPQLVERLCAVAAEVLGCDSALAYLRNEEDGDYLPAATHGHGHEQWEWLRLIRIPSEGGEALGRILSGDAVAEVATAEAQDVVGSGLAAALERVGVMRLVLIALRAGADVVAILIATRSDPAALTEEQQRIARGVAHLASLTIEHARVRGELEQANRVKAHFVATLSHELRNPITAIRGYHDLLQQGIPSPLTAQQEELVRRADKCARELNELITATLDLSRFEVRRVPLDVQPVAISSLVDELRGEIRPADGELPVRLEWIVESDGIELSTDPLKLKMVLRNLVTNALKFTEQGSVTVSAGRLDGGVEFHVTDTGIGIPADKIPSLFEPFTQAHGIRSRRKGGAGLGLHLVRRIVDVLGGSIDVSSEEGRGTTFRVWLPRIFGEGTSAQARTA